MSLREAVTIVVDHDAEEGKDIIYDESGKVKALAIAKRVIEEIPSIPLTSPEDSYEQKNEGLSPEELENEELRTDQIEFLRGEVFVPEITNQGSLKLDQVAEDQRIGIYIDRIKRTEFEKKYQNILTQKFASPLDYVVKVIVTGIFPDYSGLSVPEAIDEALGTKREKPK
jgi:hypothetical protein